MMKKTNDRGFSLVELVIVIAIMAVLIAVAAPTYVHYVQQNRATACKTNREALLGIYERCVVRDKSTALDTSTMIYVCGGSETRVAGEVAQYNRCPSGGTYTYGVTDGTAIITCDHDGHDETVRTNFVGWSGTGNNEEDDNEIPPP